jgi:hypothetical protein
MVSQVLSIEVRGHQLLLTVNGTWRPAHHAPQYTVTMSAHSEIVMPATGVCRVETVGDLEFAHEPHATIGGSHVLQWTEAAREFGDGSCVVTLSHSNHQFADVQISVDMCDVDEDSLEVQPTEVPEDPPLTNIDVVNRYGAFGCCILAAVASLIFALLMPIHWGWLVTEAVAITIWGRMSTRDYDRFLLHIIGFVIAGIIMCFALVMPDKAQSLMYAAGLTCFLTILNGSSATFDD